MTTETSPFHCPGCGREHKEEGRFCPLCGRDLKAYLQARRKSDQDPLLGQVIDQRYRVVKVIGRGGMGVVYQVEHIAMGKIMAMKLLNSQVRSRPHAVRRFRQEIKVVARLSHVHTVSVFDCGDAEDGSLYIVMEYLRGLDVEQLLQHEPMLPCERTARIARQVCASLSDAHKRGIVHRDIKPANIFLLRDGGEYDFVKVLDFGIAKLTEPGQEKVTEIGLIVGTPFYMAPEQARGSHALGPTTDIYSLGVVMYEMVTGGLPFKGKTVADFIEAHLRFEPTPPSAATTAQTIDPELEGIILRAMNKNPAERFPTVDSMQLALDTYLERQAQLKVQAINMSFPGQYSHNHTLATPTPTSQSPESVAKPTTDHFDRDAQASTIAQAHAPTDAVDAWQPNPPHTPPPVLPILDEEEPPSELLANRSDWDREERKWKWQRRFRTAFPILLFIGLLGAGGYYGWKHRDVLLPKRQQIDTTVRTKEHEPNNNILQATTIQPGPPIPGKLGAPTKGRPSDFDWYRVSFPANKPVRLSLSLIPPSFANVELGLYRLEVHQNGNQTTKRPKEVRTSDSGLRGGIERFRSYLWPGGDLYILVRELVIPGETSQRGDYTLLVQTLPPETNTPTQETEPNERFQQATTLMPNKEVKGYHDFRGDIDYYTFEAKGKRNKARCQLRINQATKQHPPKVVLLDAKGQSLRTRIKRFSFRPTAPSGKPKTRRRRRRKTRKKAPRRRAFTLYFRAEGTHFVRVSNEHPNTDQSYELFLKCK